MKYRKKPVIIEAVQWDGENLEEIIGFVGENNIKLSTELEGEDDFTYIEDTLYIKTLEGDMLASKGDFIIKGVQGEFYPCKPDIFEQTYEAI